MADKHRVGMYVAVFLGGVLLSPWLGAAHPLGNFSISHYTEIRLLPAHIELHYLVDMAEIPTFQELQDTGLVAEEQHVSVPGYLVQRAEALGHGLFLEVDGHRLPLQNVAREIAFPPGAGGLPTLKMALVYQAPFRLEAGSGPASLHYQDTNFAGRAGWQEIIALADPSIALVHSSVPATDRSQRLRTYPTDLLNSPPQVLQARVLFRRASDVPPMTAGTSSLSAPAQAMVPPLGGRSTSPTTSGKAFTDLITSQQLSVGVICLALAVAAGLGALHALEPGHGKTVVAAYLVGSRGTAWHAISLGLIVTLTHTLGVYLLGAVTLYASRYVVPEQLYPWLSVCSGLLIFGLGGWLVFRRLRRNTHGHPRTHHHGHTHHATHAQVHSHHHHSHHPGHDHPEHHGHPHHHHEVATEVSYRELLTLGVTGGIVPCPAALVVLLSAIALRRVGFGLLLIVAFSAGLAAVLIAIGVLMVYARRFMARFQMEGPLITRWLPLTSAATISAFGLAMVFQALSAAGVLHFRL